MSFGGNMAGWGVLETGWRKGPWTAEEDRLLIEYVRHHGEGRWSSVARLAGLKRNGKSCRLRWVNYLRPDLKRGQITPHEERIILELHARWGNRWSTIARSLPGRTDNEIKNYWRTHFKKKAKSPNSCGKIRTCSNMKKQKHQQEEEQKKQQQLVQLNQLDMKKLAALFDDRNDTYNKISCVTSPQVSTTTAYAAGDKEEPDDCYPTASWYAPPAAVTEAMGDDAFLEGLWNLEDRRGSFGGDGVSHKGWFQNPQVTPFC